MTTLITRCLFIAIVLILSHSCKERSEADFDKQVIFLRDSLRHLYIPDGRVARFNVDIAYEEGKLILTGETDQPDVLDVFMNSLPEGDIRVESKISVLPDESTKEFPFAIVNNSVSNLRTKPKHSAELTSQTLLGTVLKVLKITDEWYLVQTPDDYIAWIDHGGVKLKTKEELENWQNADKVIVTAVNTIAFDERSSDPVSDLVLGDILEKVATDKQYTLVRFPDGRRGKVENQAVRGYAGWLSQIDGTQDLIEFYARQLMGAPYLWGGTSSKGMDCSGFTKTVYYMNGLVIPRDASQQVNAGRAVDENLVFEGLEKGDLLFFGKPATDSTKQRTTHVGIWLGANEFIHASKQVRVSSIDPTSPNYDEFNKNRYLGSRRYLRNLEGNITDLRTQLIQK